MIMASKRAALVQRRLDAAETVYMATLKAALEHCAKGRWGLFGQNPQIDGLDRYTPAALDELNDLAAEIDGLRSKLGHEPFPLHARFQGLRGRQSENQLGESKLAAQLLAELRSRDC
jgi:hypothetical protein